MRLPIAIGILSINREEKCIVYGAVSLTGRVCNKIVPLLFSKRRGLGDEFIDYYKAQFLINWAV